MLLTKFDIGEKVNKLLREYFKEPLDININRKQQKNVIVSIQPAALHGIEYRAYVNDFNDPKKEDPFILSISTTCRYAYNPFEDENGKVDAFGYIEDISIEIDREGKVCIPKQVMNINLKNNMS